MNIFKRELLSRLKPTLIWAASIMALLFIGMYEYSGFKENPEEINSMMDAFPRVLKVIFGMADYNLATGLGYMQTLHLYLLAAAGVFAAMLGSGIIADEEIDKTADFLLSRPVTRIRVLYCKLAAAVVHAFLLALVILLSSLASFASFTDGERYPIALAVGILLFELFFIAVGMLVAATKIRCKLASGVSSGILLLGYVLATVYRINLSPGFLQYLTPFEYFNAVQLGAGNLSLVLTVLSLLLTAAMAACAFILYPKRDIR